MIRSPLSQRCQKFQSYCWKQPGCCQPIAGGKHPPALLLRSDVGETMKRKKAQKGFGQLAIKHLQKSPTCEATRCITWQSGHTTRLGLAPPAPPSTSQPKSHVSVCEDRGFLLRGFLPVITSLNFKLFETKGAARLFFARLLYRRLTSLFGFL